MWIPVQASIYNSICVKKFSNLCVVKIDPVNHQGKINHAVFLFLVTVPNKDPLDGTYTLLKALLKFSVSIHQIEMNQL